MQLLFDPDSKIMQIIGRFGRKVAGNLFLFHPGNFPAGHSHLLAMPVFVVPTLIFICVFPQLSRFRNSTKDTLKNTSLLRIAYLPHSFVILIINGFPWVLMALNLYTFKKLGFLRFSRPVGSPQNDRASRMTTHKKTVLKSAPCSACQ